jgi:phage regulator Rha-like protein
MDSRNTIQRAFEIAASGEVRTFDELRRKLQAERYEAVEAHLAGTAIRKQLKEIIASSLLARPQAQA